MIRRRNIGVREVKDEGPRARSKDASQIDTEER